MPSNIHTLNSAPVPQPLYRYLSLRGKDPSPPPSPPNGGVGVDLTATIPPAFGALSVEAYPKTQLTPALGVEFGPSLRLKEVLRMQEEERNRILRDLAVYISLHGVCVFKDQADLVPKDLADLGLLLGELSGKPSTSTLHIHPTQNLGENGLPIGEISNSADKDGRQISFMDETSEIASAGWHSDVSFEPVPASYTLLRMHTLPPSGGDTLFSSGYKMFDKLSPALAAFLSTLSAVHDAETFRVQSRRHGFALRTEPRGSPLNAGDSFQAVHPIIRTNPVTGLKTLFVNRTFTKRIVGLTVDESRSLLEYLFRLQEGSFDAQARIKWDTNDLVIWDNRCTEHAATWDYGKQDRRGDRVVCCGEAPYYSEESMSRKEWEKWAVETGKA